jgi:cytidylate kinase
VARRLAERLGFAFLDTGAMYRALAAWCLQEKVCLDDASAIGNLAEVVTIEFEADCIFVNGTDLTDDLRTEAVTIAASRIAVIPEVREALVRMQREAARGKDIVTEGRDQGTVAFPKAECKFFVTATPQERARRRLRELEAQGQTADGDEVLKQILERDARDASREVAPLKPASDAQILDTTSMKFEEVLALLEQEVRTRQCS